MPNFVIKEENKKPIKVWADIEDVEESALLQLKNLSGLPFIHQNGIAAMPDVHWGIGATVGSVIATKGAIIPAAVGVDIGCGMNAVRLNIKASELPDDLKGIRSAIESVVPVGNADHRDIAPRLQVSFVLGMFETMPELFKTDQRWEKQIGTLGGGNHFIELCIDENQDVWVMLHSGSRGIGNKIGRHYISAAKEIMQKHFISLPDMDLAYLPEKTKEFDDYCKAVEWAQDYAFLNRQTMMVNVIAALTPFFPKKISTTEEAINCHHNYISQENHFGENLWITRKGAIQAREGSLGIIPGSMGKKSFIVRGKGNAQSYCSCSHGAGRKMSRTEASKRFTIEDLAEQTQGVECRKDQGVIDEIPGAYKDIDKVMAQQTDLIDIVHTLKQVICIKG